MTATGSTKASLESKLPENGGITPHVAGDMWANLGREYAAIVIAEVSERTEPAHEEDKDPAVKLKILNVELPRDDDEANWLRELLNAWYRRRTATGTLEDGTNTAETDAASARAILTAGGDLGALLSSDHLVADVTVNGQPVTTVRELADHLSR